MWSASCLSRFSAVFCCCFAILKRVKKKRFKYIFILYKCFTVDRCLYKNNLETLTSMHIVYENDFIWLNQQKVKFTPD